MRGASKVFVVIGTAVALLVCSVGVAQQEKARKAKKARKVAVHPLVQRVLSTVKDLSEEQKTKLQEIGKKYATELAALRRKAAGILTPDQRRARVEAIKKARQEKLKGAELRKRVEAAVQLTDEQKKQLAEVERQIRALEQKLREEILAVLTPAQREQVSKALKAKRKLGQKKRRAKAKKTEQP